MLQEKYIYCIYCSTIQEKKKKEAFLLKFSMGILKHWERLIYDEIWIQYFFFLFNIFKDEERKTGQICK